MAIIKDNKIMRGVSGKFGDVVVYRQLRGKTIMANKPSKPTTQSELQRENRRRFAKASAFAKHVLQDPQKKEYYLQKARKLKLPNAYTAAITDYMRKPMVMSVKCRGNAGENVMIIAAKKGFSLSSVTVSLVNRDGVSIATSNAMPTDRQRHEWKARLAAGPGIWNDTTEGGRIIVMAIDHAGNVVNNVMAA
jgi:hypothetical protein